MPVGGMADYKLSEGGVHAFFDLLQALK